MCKNINTESHIFSQNVYLSFTVQCLHQTITMFIMAALRSRYGHYIFALWFLSFFSSPNLSGRRLDVYHTSTHGVAPVRIYNAGMKCTACGSLKMQDAKNCHLGSITQLCQALSSQLRHISTIRKETC